MSYKTLLASLSLIFLAACSNTTTLSLPSATSIPPTEITPLESASSALASLTATSEPLITVTPLLLNSTPTNTQISLPIITASPTPVPPTRFAIIGDYGMGNSPEAQVADLVISWKPDFVVTVGDNNYPNGEAATIDDHIGQYYHSFIYPYTGSFGQGANQNLFFPVLGNHDWLSQSAQPYLDYFTLPGNERYYDFVWGPVHFFCLDSDSHEPDGVGKSSAQADWLKAGLAGSTSPWNLVFMHHSPYSSGLHGPVDWMRWPFKKWGASAVLAGHDHTYERLVIDGFPYFINGLGGGPRYDFTGKTPGSQVRYNQNYGAMLVEASQTTINFAFYNIKGEQIDSYSLTTSP